MENKFNILLSYPRSGNHLCRFFIELLSGIPTLGCLGNENDIEIYKNKFKENIPFNIKKDYNRNDSFIKMHKIDKDLFSFIKELNLVNKIILIIRNPKEVLLRNGFMNFTGEFNNYEIYFKLIDQFNQINGKKIIIYYEDMINNKEKFINILYNFLDLNNEEKKKYVLSNIDKLYKLCSTGKFGDWGGINSNFETKFYYNKLDKNKKKNFSRYLNYKLNKYPFLKKKYNI